ncbi:Xylose isomerase domain protein TIM barrel [Vibrio nigripulchritudo SO65]|uniref:sugar phosphate isomerase/epimerase family protein n=1 Tax=Vibrio nigripulchritudo TaxID=28173 RepID=UPI0003B238D2|nr:sugar phosphate isomerase/epimerase [Vibrio nigripulchritudo]CCN36104.1 Xylose isomerase domain protein TIM barrel [Vibrio nigripulchritudo AM115]CCN44384.1 Xylose isomerase domain protein TIM barrel [Vibrio nigripulchritudo FTn2]CCN68121.1 Xylose isomerase domain protein TIM barrel [Vibrio nigripulchritudo POn4]CCN75367.1 Xylose isomerase domain protein TIM barrel [Vibrio nigripulchritudo SO65]
MSAWKLAYQANCWGPLGGNAVGVTSINQLTYRTFADMALAFKEIAKAGYEGVELFDGNLLDYSVADFKRLLSDNQLSFVAAYSGGNFIYQEILDEELDRIRMVADRAAELGAPHLVVGGGAQRYSGIQEDDYEKLADALTQVDTIAKERGLQGHYHPHLTTIVESPDQVEKIFNLTPIHFCPDTAHLAAARGDPAKLIREHASRISYVHLKGWQKEPFAFTPIDRGDIDTKPIIEALKANQYQGWVTVELDAWEDPYQGALASKQYLDREKTDK